MLILSSIRKVNYSDSEATLWTRSASDSIKGVAAILIILHHVSWKVDEANMLIWIYREINLFVVGVFLFFSGFGLLKSYKNRGDLIIG